MTVAVWPPRDQFYLWFRLWKSTTSLLMLWNWQSLSKQEVLKQTGENWIDIWGIIWIWRPVTSFRDHLSFKSLEWVGIFRSALQWIRHAETNSTLSKGLSWSSAPSMSFLGSVFNPLSVNFSLPVYDCVVLWNSLHSKLVLLGIFFFFLYFCERLFLSIYIFKLSAT